MKGLKGITAVTMACDTGKFRAMRSLDHRNGRHRERILPQFA